jgi:hypothetical protein
MQKQLEMSPTEADKLLEKAEKMNDQLFNGGGTAMGRRITETVIEEDSPHELQGIMSSEDRGEIRKIRDPDDDTGMTADQLNKIFFPKRAATRKMPAVPAVPARGMKGGGSVASEEYYAHGGAAKKQKRGKSNKHGAFSKGPGQGAMVKGTNFRGVF